MKKILQIFLLIACAYSNKAQDYNPVVDSLTAEINEVVITATRNSRFVNSLPVPSLVITETEIQSKQINNLADLLSEIPGISIQPDFGGGEGIQLQGLDSEYVLILIDGTPMIGRRAGTFDLNRILLQQVKQIEIVKGASSSLFGNEALGGVINIITKKPNKKQIDITSKFGSNTTGDVFASLQTTFQSIGIGANIRHFQTDGYSLNEDSDLPTKPEYNNQEANITITKQSNKTSYQLRGRYFHQSGEDAFLADTQKDDEWNSQLLISHKLTSKLNGELDFSATGYNSSYEEADDFYEEQLLQPEFRINYHYNHNHLLLGGIGYKLEELDRSLLASNANLNTQYAYLQYDGIYLNDKLNVVAGARYDNHQDYQSRLSPKLSARYELNQIFAIRASVGSGFKRPDFRHLYYNFSNPAASYQVIGTEQLATTIADYERLGVGVIERIPISNFSSGLKPESSVNTNFGVQINLKNSEFDINGFYNQIDDLIDVVTAAEVQSNNTRIFSYQNSNQVNTMGVEINNKTSLNETTNLNVGYQYLITEDVSVKEKFSQGNGFIRDPETLETIRIKESDYFGLFNRSKHMASLAFFKTIEKWNSDTNFRTTYRSKYGVFDTNNNQALDVYDEFVKGYAIIDWSYNYHLNKNVKLGFSVDNILDYTDEENIPNIPGRLISGALFINF